MSISDAELEQLERLAQESIESGRWWMDVNPKRMLRLVAELRRLRGD